MYLGVITKNHLSRILYVGLLDCYNFKILLFLLSRFQVNGCGQYWIISEIDLSFSLVCIFLDN